MKHTPLNKKDSQKPRPIIGRVGGKVMLSPWVVSHLKRFHWSLYCEPFCGSCAVFFKLIQEGVFDEIKRHGYQPRMILNDADSRIIHLFKTVRDYPDLLAFKTHFTPYSREEHKYSQSQPNLSNLDDLEQELEMARLTLIDSWQSFKKESGDSWGIETNSHDAKSSVKQWEGVVDRLLTASHYFKQCFIENDDFEAVLSRYESPHSCFYLDPPYINAEGYYAVNKGQSKDALMDMHYRLAKKANTVTASCVAISYYPCDLVEQLYPSSDWEYHYKETVAHSCGVTRNSKTTTRPKRTELLLIRRDSVPSRSTIPSQQLSMLE